MSPSSKTTENEDQSPNKENYEMNRPKLLKKPKSIDLPPPKSDRLVSMQGRGVRI